jgi:hypothetical protein
MQTTWIKPEKIESLQYEQLTHHLIFGDKYNTGHLETRTKIPKDEVNKRIGRICRYL